MDIRQNTSPNNFTLDYVFKFNALTQKKFSIDLEPKTLEMICPPKNEYPEWTSLKCQQCPNCPLNATQHPQCPIARNLVDVIDFFSSILSFQEVDISIKTSQRDYFKHTATSNAVSSMMGIFMVASGCPILDKFRPMVRFHLPFASLEESIYRMVSMYLLSQYLVYKQQGTPDWDMKNLGKICKDINIVNVHFLNRIRTIPNIKDSSLNAIVTLNCFAQTINFLDQALLDELKPLFKSYIS